MNEIEASKKISDLLENGYKKKAITQKIGISWPTLQKRLKVHNWTKTELFFIESL